LANILFGLVFNNLPIHNYGGNKMMTQVQPTTPQHREKLEDILVVDVDFHIHESPAELEPYSDMPWKKSLQVLSSVPDRYLDIPSFSPGGGAYMAPFPGGHSGGRVTTPEQARKELDELFINIAILFPDHFLKIALLPEVDYATALARAYNAWLVDKWVDPGKGLLGAVMAVPHDPEDAAREIEKYAHHPGIVGVYLPCAGVEPLWGHRKYDPIHRAAEAADLPILLHAVTVVYPTYPWQIQQFDTEIARHTMGHPFSMMANIVSMITTGVVVRFPNLRICLVEAGVSWVPFIMNRLDKEYMEQRRQIPFLEQRPSHYIRKFGFATQPVEEPENPQDLATLMHLFGGEDTIMFASDWPHHDFDHPNKVFQLPISPEERRKIMGENALRFFKIDAQARRLNL
jgi:predicted TIM-barrel fold metal-dependent hydrolase